MPTAKQNEFQALATNLSGRVTTPQDSGWDEARLSFNLSADQQPAAVIHTADARDVSATVRFASEHGLRLAPQVTGHGAVALELDGTLLLKTTEMKGVEIDAGARQARVGSGVTWAEVLEPAAAEGLAALHGSSARSASSATPSAAASAGTGASTACRPTASPRSNWSTPRESCAPTTRPSPSCSGRSAAAAATSASSPRSSSS